MSAHQFDATSTTLLFRLRSGEVGSWERLTRLYGPLVRYWCKRWGIPDAELDDVTQEIWVGLGPTLEGYRPGGNRSFRAWVRGVTHHKTQDWHRRQSKQLSDAAGGTAMIQFLQQVESSPDDEATEDAEELVQKQALYGRALGEIRGEFENRSWEIFVAVAVDGRPVAEIATEFGLTSASVRKVKSRVLHRLRQELGELIL